jgi:hypothetical protein
MEVLARLVAGSYERAFDLRAGPVTLHLGDAHKTEVVLSAFEHTVYESPHPVQITCAVTCTFTVPADLEDSFEALARGEMPPESISAAEVDKSGSYSIPFDQYPADLQHLMSKIHGLQLRKANELWRLLRWRLDAHASHNIFSTYLESVWSFDEAAWYPLPLRGSLRVSERALPRITDEAVSSVEELFRRDVGEPVSQELLREAIWLIGPDPRASLLLAVAALEIGFKEMLVDFSPATAWFSLNAPAPPVVPMLRHLLPNLPVRRGNASEAPKELRKVVQAAIEARNALAHQGQFNRLSVDLENTCEVVGMLLKQFGYWRDFEWLEAAW